MIGIHGRTRGSRGFSMAELLIVLLIILILAGMLLAAVMGIQGGIRRNMARADIQALSVALAAFYRDHESYPPDSEDMRAIYAGTKRPDIFFFPTDIGEPRDFMKDALLGDNPARSSNELLVYFLGSRLRKGHNHYGPYMQFRARQLRDTDGDGYMEFIDPWGNPYSYAENYSDNRFADPDKRKGHGPFDIFSMGPDGKRDPGHDGTDGNNDGKIDSDAELVDDITSWNM